MAVGYYVMPKGLVVLLGFTEDGITNLQDVNQFLSFLMRFMLVFGVAFLIPEVVLVLNIVGVLKAKYLSKYRSLIIFGTFVFGAVATPSTDPFSMLALALPMTVLFIVAEVIAHVLDRRKARRGTLDPVARDRALRGAVRRRGCLTRTSLAGKPGRRAVDRPGRQPGRGEGPGARPCCRRSPDGSATPATRWRSSLSRSPAEAAELVSRRRGQRRRRPRGDGRRRHGPPRA